MKALIAFWAFINAVLHVAMILVGLWAVVELVKWVTAHPVG